MSIARGMDGDGARGGNGGGHIGASGASLLPDVKAKDAVRLNAVPCARTRKGKLKGKGKGHWRGSLGPGLCAWQPAE